MMEVMGSRYPQISVKSIEEKDVQENIKCSIVVRILRVYIPHDKSGQPRLLCAILMDSEGTKILATTSSSQSTKFKSLLEEGQIRMISNFKLSLNKPTMSSARLNHPVKIDLGFNTKVTTLSDVVHIPHNGFEFVMFRDIPCVDPQYTLDVVGRYISHTPIERVGSYKARKLDVNILDHHNKKLTCVLWESYADQLIQFIESRGGNRDSFTIALQFVSVTKFQENYRVQTMKGPSILLMDKQSDEISAFLNSHADDQISLPNSVDSGHLLDWFSPNGCKSIKEILQCTESGVYTTVAEVVQIDDTEWYYNRCDKCTKRVRDEVKVGDTCPRCDKVIEKITPTYHIKLEACDDTGTTYFVLFESQAASIMGKSSADMLQTLEKENRRRDFPEEFQVFCDKTWIFRIHVKEQYNLINNNKDYTVTELSTDEQLISQFKKGNTSAEVHSVPQKHHNEKGSSVVTTTGATIADTLEEISSNSVTPQKRSMADTLTLNEQNSGDVQLSATKILKKEGDTMPVKQHNGKGTSDANIAKASVVDTMEDIAAKSAIPPETNVSQPVLLSNPKSTNVQVAATEILKKKGHSLPGKHHNRKGTSIVNTSKVIHWRRLLQILLFNRQQMCLKQ